MSDTIFLTYVSVRGICVEHSFIYGFRVQFGLDFWLVKKNKIKMSNFVSMVEEHINESDDIIAKSDFSAEPFLGCQKIYKVFVSTLGRKACRLSYVNNS